MTVVRDQFLQNSKTAKYTPRVLGFSQQHIDHRGFFTLYDVQVMRRDPRIRLGLRILYSPLPTVTWKVYAKNEQVKQYVDRTLRKFWQNELAKAFKCVVYGWCGGELFWTQKNGLIEFDRLAEVHPLDLKPLQIDNRLCGVSISSISPGDGVEDGRNPWDKNNWILPPRALWLAYESEFGSLYGQSRLQGAWVPFQEKVPRHGALDVRRLWFLKNAYRGGLMRHPSGTIEVAEGQFRTCQDYAREIVEKMETGGVLTLPNTKDFESKEYEWVYEPPQAHGEPIGVQDYVKDLDVEMLEGLEIPPEVAHAAETGSGWAGRSVPFLVFLSGEDQIANTIAHGFDRQAIRHGVEVNFGPQEYSIVLDSLVPSGMEESATQSGGEGGQNNQQGRPQQQPPGDARLGLLVGESIPWHLEEEDLVRLGWEAYGQSKTGTKRWKNTESGQIRYQEKAPQERKTATPKASGQSKAEEQEKKPAAKPEPVAKPKAAPKTAPKAAKGPKPTVAEVYAAYESLRANDSQEGRAQFAGHLEQLTVAELGQIKKAIGVKASGVKRELIDKIKERALLAVKQQPKTAIGPEAAGKPRPAPTPAKTEQPGKPKDEEPGFTGTDSLGREWRNGELVAAKEEPAKAREGQEDWKNYLKATHVANQKLAGLGGNAGHDATFEFMKRFDETLTREKFDALTKQWAGEDKLNIRDIGAAMAEAGIDQAKVSVPPLKIANEEAKWKNTLKAMAVIEKNYSSNDSRMTIPDIFDLVKMYDPTITLQDFHQAITKFADDDKLTVGIVNDPHFEPRAHEGVQQGNGTGFYVKLRDLGGMLRDAGMSGDDVAPPAGWVKTPNLPQAPSYRFTGVDPDGRKWKNGNLVSKEGEPGFTGVDSAGRQMHDGKMTVGKEGQSEGKQNSPISPEPGFSGFDTLGRHWTNGKLDPAKEKPVELKGATASKDHVAHKIRANKELLALVDQVAADDPIGKHESAFAKFSKELLKKHNILAGHGYIGHAIEMAKGNLPGLKGKAKANEKARIEELERLHEQDKTLMGNLEKARTESVRRAADLLKSRVKQPAKVSHSFATGIPQEHRLSFDQGVSILQDAIADTGIPLVYQIVALDNKKRPHYAHKGGEGYINYHGENKEEKLAFPRVAVHEMLHRLEYDSPEISRAVAEFVKYRVGDEKSVKLNDVAQKGGYDDHEVGRKDNFERAFGGDKRKAYYCGKEYAGQQSSEILTMGSELFFANPSKFARDDPEFFAFFVGIMDGSLRKEKTKP